MILPHLLYAISTGIFIFTFFTNNLYISYPVYIAPAAVYALFYLSVFVLAKIEKKHVSEKIKGISMLLYVFAILAMAPLIMKLNLPEPHNFAQRKLEILLGASFAFFVILLMGAVLKSFSGTFAKEKCTVKQVFMYILAVFFTFYFSISLWFNYANAPTGDEPAYLLTAHSLVYDRDLDLKNNFENRDYEKFYNRELKPQTADIIRGEKLYSYHPFFFSLLISPFYMLAGRFGVTIFINAISAIYIAMIFYFLYRFFGNMKTATAVSAIVGLTMPVLGQINSISADVIIGLLLLSEYIIIKYHNDKVFVFNAVMAAVVWVHIKSIPVCAALSLLYVIYNRKNLKNLFIFFTAQILNTVLFLAVNYHIYGVFVSSHTGPGQTAVDLLSTNMFKGIAAFFFDRQLGLFAYAPVFVLIISGMYYMLKQRKAEFLESTLIVVPYLCLISMINNLGGGSASPRYFVPIIFYFALLLAAALKEMRSKISNYVYNALAVCGFILSAIICMVPWFRWDRPAGENNILTIFSKYLKIDLTVIFPSFQLPGENYIPVFIIWALAVVSLNIFLIKKDSERKAGFEYERKK